MTPLTTETLADLERLEAEAEREGRGSIASVAFLSTLRNHAKALIEEVREAREQKPVMDAVGAWMLSSSGDTSGIFKAWCDYTGTAYEKEASDG